MSKLRFGVIGVGSLGFHHARILREVAGVELVGIHDADAARGRWVSEELGVRSFSTQDELLASIDAAVVAVPTTAHAAVALPALRRGIHVLIEKPIAPTLAEAEEIVHEASASGALVGTGHVERFNAALRACEPYLGEPQFVESHRLAPFGVRGTDVAVVLDLMIHDIDLVLSLIRKPVRSVAAVGVPVLTGSADIANARITFEGGAVANITASRISPERMRKIRLFQRSGYLSLDLARGGGEFLRLRPDAAATPGEGATSIAALAERVELVGDGVEPLRAELSSFADAVRGKGPLVVSGDDGRRALAVALEIMRCIDSAGDLSIS